MTLNGIKTPCIVTTPNETQRSCIFMLHRPSPSNGKKQVIIFGLDAHEL
jgi:hypothetical protein